MPDLLLVLCILIILCILGTTVKVTSDILVLLLLLALCGISLTNANNDVVVYSRENMAPLDWGVIPNKNYVYGKCNRGSFAPSDCSVGNCPLDSTISNDEFCRIQCIQDPDQNTRNKCYNQCMTMMEGCR
jgi:hypothetical protein